MRPLASSRLNAWRIRSPDTDSWRSALTSETRSRASSYALTLARRKKNVPMTSGGSVTKTTSASCTSITSRATMMPKKVTTETNAVTSPVCRNVDSASTSVVIRVMIRPVSSRS